jgi:UDP-glucose 4-epimerase
MKILVLGAAGFAGSGITKKMIGLGHEVTALDIVSPHMAWALMDIIDNPHLKYKWKALRDIQKEDIEGHDVIVHLAAQADVPMGITSPRWTIMENVEETISLLEMCRGVKGLKKIIYAGSGNEFGRPMYFPIDEKHPLTPHNPYSFSKAAAEMAYWTYHRCYGLPIVIMSNGAVLGPGMRRDIFVFIWLRALIKGLPLVLEGGDQTRDLTYASDVMEAWKLAIEAPEEKVIGEKFQVSYGHEDSVEDIMKMCIEIAEEKPVEIVKVPHRPGEKGQRELFTNKKARKVLGYDPQIGTKLGIKMTYEWMKSLSNKEL